MTKQLLEQKIPVRFPGKVTDNWKNGVKDWHIHNATPGLYTLDIEHVSEEMVTHHNDPQNYKSVSSRYRNLCLHKCPACFNEQSVVYSKLNLDGTLNRILTLGDTLRIVDEAREIAKEEGHEFQSVKFLGPGELLINPHLFMIIDEYEKRNIQFNIFTKGAILGSDKLAQEYQGRSSKELIDRLASYSNVGLLMNFQSFNDELQDNLVTSRTLPGFIEGLKGYTQIRDHALVNIFGSRFYTNGITNRICIINAPIIPENIDESFDIYKFFIERATPVVMTPSMLSGKGCGQYERQGKTLDLREWHNKLVELYAKIYAYNVKKGVQTDEQILYEGIASYVGAEPCNQVSTGLYIRANGLVQMCPGRFDRETIYTNLHDTSLKQIWQNSFNRRMGIENPQNLVNNRCPAKDGYAFSKDFYLRVMERYQEILETERRCEELS